MKNTLETSGEDVFSHSKRVEKMGFSHSKRVEKIRSKYDINMTGASVRTNQDLFKKLTTLETG